MQAYWIISSYIAPEKLQEIKATAINELLSVFLKVIPPKLTKILKKIKFSQLWIGDIDKAHENFIQKVMSVIDNLALSKNKRIKGTSEDWFDDEIIEKINLRDKVFKKSCLYNDEDNFKEVRNELQKLIRTIKKAYFESKLTQNIGKSKELWKSL